MQVPEATVDVYDLPQSRKYEIGSARERANVESVTVAEGMDEPADRQIRSRVLRLDRRHDARSLALGNGVDHDTKGFISGWDRH